MKRAPVPGASGGGVMAQMPPSANVSISHHAAAKSTPPRISRIRLRTLLLRRDTRQLLSTSAPAARRGPRVRAPAAGARSRGFGTVLRRAVAAALAAVQRAPQQGLRMRLERAA